MAIAPAIVSFLPLTFFEKRPFNFFNAGTLKQIPSLVNSLAMIFIFDANERDVIYRRDDIMPVFIDFLERLSVYSECITLGIQSRFSRASSASMQKTLSTPQARLRIRQTFSARNIANKHATRLRRRRHHAPVRPWTTMVSIATCNARRSSRSRRIIMNCVLSPSATAPLAASLTQTRLAKAP